MRINIESEWRPKGPPPPKVDQLENGSRLFMYQDRMANANRNFKFRDMFVPRSKIAE